MHHIFVIRVHLRLYIKYQVDVTSSFLDVISLSLISKSFVKQKINIIEEVNPLGLVNN